MQTFQRGDHLRVGRLLYCHHGLYLGDNKVIHYKEQGNNQICITSLEDFALGDQIVKVDHPKRTYSPEQAIQRALQRFSEQDYHLLFNNCEHFVNYCIEGRDESSQVVDACAAIGAAAISLLAARRGNRVAAVASAGVAIYKLGEYLKDTQIGETVSDQLKEVSSKISDVVSGTLVAEYQHNISETKQQLQEHLKNTFDHLLPKHKRPKRALAK